jgi:hypothetical protein
MMAFCNHLYDTQTNETLNQVIAKSAPKSVCYSSNISLYARIALVIGIHNLGHFSLFAELFRELCVLMTPTLARFLEQKETKKISKQKYDLRVDVKVKGSRKQKKQWIEVYKEHTDKSYGPGVAVITEISSTMKEKNKCNAENKCKCGSTTHRRSTHRDCPLNKKTTAMLNLRDHSQSNQQQLSVVLQPQDSLDHGQSNP